ncbi:hypothetical protein N7541_006426 [Penicillium brevicompactum]|uniref:Uncharacterized protein n=1 Tax=Penicillium brevicompactum TaxID=5074 RepID=A0A9W9UQS6_PENBR|nr:hypothetical protein N7541_006426 [Penicillium brevicompactum]
MEITKNQVTKDLAFDQVRAGSSKTQRSLDLDSEENHELPSPEVLSSTSVSGPQARDTVMSGALQLAAAEEEGVWSDGEGENFGAYSFAPEEAYELPRQ